MHLYIFILPTSTVAPLCDTSFSGQVKSEVIMGLKGLLGDTCKRQMMSKAVREMRIFIEAAEKPSGWFNRSTNG